MAEATPVSETKTQTLTLHTLDEYSVNFQGVNPYITLGYTREEWERLGRPVAVTLTPQHIAHLN